jgi:hypothetical protein
VLNPFATKLLIVSEQTLTTHALRFGFYALLQVLESGMLYAMLRHLISRKLAAPPPALASSMTRKCLGMLLGFGLSIPVFFATIYAWVLWLVPLVLAGEHRLRRRRRRNQGTAAT